MQIESRKIWSKERGDRTIFHLPNDLICTSRQQNANEEGGVHPKLGTILVVLLVAALCVHIN